MLNLLHPLGVFAALFFGAALAAQDVPKSAEPTKVSQPAKSTPAGLQALAEAKALAARVKGLKGPARSEALQEAARAYLAVAERIPADRPTCATAC